MTLTKPAADFLKKLGLYWGIGTAAVVATLLLPWHLKLIPQFVLGAMFAHGVELEHEMIHQRHFGKRWGDGIGFLLGLPMLVEFSRYRVTHCYHHRAVGTPDDEESFSYDFGQLGAPVSFLLHLSMVSHYIGVVKNMAYALVGNRDRIRERMGNAGKTAARSAVRQIMRGYCVMAGLLVGAIALSIVLKSGLLIQLWLIPLIFANPIHALVELPEHWGCDTTSTDMMVNTRTITPSAFAYWFTNGNCWHVEHHYRPALPMADLPELHGEIAPQIQFSNHGYGEFYLQFFAALFKSQKLAH
ncbi:MAG: fatty acid desaturase [Cyanobacteria bacterium P01_D01_bin.73]